MAIRLRKRLTLSSMHDVELDLPPDDGDQIEWDDDLGKWVNVPGYQLAEANPTGLIDGGELNIAPVTDNPEQTHFGAVTISDESAALEWQCIRDDDGTGSPDDDWGPVADRLADARIVTVGPTTTLYIDSGQIGDTGQISCLATSATSDPSVKITTRTNVQWLDVIPKPTQPGADGIEVLPGVGLIVDSYSVPDTPPTRAAVSWNQINTEITAAPAVAGSIVYLTMANVGGSGPYPDTELGELRQYATPPTQATRRDEIPLGLIIYDGEKWGEVSSPTVINNTAQTLEDYLNAVAGPTFIIDGGTVREGAGYTLDQDAGTIWEMNRNWHISKKEPHREPLPATTGIQWRYVNRDFSDVSALTSTVDPGQYDDGGTVSPIPGTNNRATIQQLYQDPRDNYWLLWGQAHFDNFIEAAASLVPLTEVPPLLQQSVLLGFVIAEKGQADWDADEARFLQPQGSGGVGGGGVPITRYTELVDTPTDYIGAARTVQTVNDAETDVIHQYSLRFVPYVAGSTWYPQEVVYRGLWQMVANTITTDDPMPTPVGSPTWALPDAPVWGTFSDESVVHSGHLYTFRQDGYFKGLRVHVPDLSASTNYRFLIIRNPSSSIPTTTIIEEPVLNEDAWTNLAAATELVLAGEELLVVIDALNSGDSVTWAYNWERDTGSNNEGGFPPFGMWNTNSGNSILRINWIDAETIPTGHQLELQVIPGSLFEISEVGDPARYSHFSTTGAYIEDPANGYTRYPCVLVNEGAGGARVGEACQVRSVQPIAQPTSFVGIDSYWTDLTYPSWATVQSYLEYDGVPQAVQGDEAYGIDILYQPITKSDDWDVFGFDG